MCSRRGARLMSGSRRNGGGVPLLPPYIEEVDPVSKLSTFYSPHQPMDGVGKEGDKWCIVPPEDYIRICTEMLQEYLRGGLN